MQSRRIVLHTFRMSVMATPLRSAESIMGSANRKSTDSPQSTTVLALLVTGSPLAYSGVLLDVKMRLTFALLALGPGASMKMPLVFKIVDGRCRDPGEHPIRMSVMKSSCNMSDTFVGLQRIPVFRSGVHVGEYTFEFARLHAPSQRRAVCLGCSISALLRCFSLRDEYVHCFVMFHDSTVCQW